jgi:hypothetical protein
MRRLWLLWALACAAGVCGCSFHQEEVERTGHGVLPWQTDAERKAGYE